MEDSPMLRALRGAAVVPSLQALQNAPANIRTYISTLFGDRSKISEKNLSASDLAALRKAARESVARRQERIAGNEALLASRKKQSPNGFWGTTFKDGKSRPTTKAEVVADTQKRLKNAQRPATIAYDNYGTGGDGVDAPGWFRMAKESFTNPAYRMATTVGLANLQTDPQGNLHVLDHYDFNGDAPGRYMVEQFKRGNIGEALGLLATPTATLDALGYLFAPDTDKKRRPVDINLGPIGQQLKKQKK